MTCVVIWDAREPVFWRGGLYKRVRAWLISQDIPTADTYRVEIHLVDVPFARVFTYALDSQGNRHMDTAILSPLTNEPYDKILSELPPAELEIDLQAGPAEL